MAELGETDDPTQLVPGKPEAIEENARVLRARASEAGGAADGLKAIDTGSWSGPAAAAFHDKFSYEPGKWYTAADSLQAAAGALDDYASTLRWAQGQATEAIAQWDQAQRATQQAQAAHDQAAAQASANNQPAPAFSDPGDSGRQAARDTLNRARSQLAAAGDLAAGILRGETDAAPQKTSWLDDVGHTLAQAGADVVNGVASFGNAMINHPMDVLGAAGGLGLTAISSAGEGLGVVLDATGIGAIPGGALNVVSAGGIAAGVTATGMAMANIASHAAGDDHVEPIQAGNDSAGGSGGTPPKEISGTTKHGEEQALGRDGGRGVSDEAMHDAVTNPAEPVEVQPSAQGPKYKYVGQDATVVLNQDGKVITTYATSRTGWRNP